MHLRDVCICCRPSLVDFEYFFFDFCFTLWAVNDRWSHANVTSTKSSSSRKWRNDDRIDDWKSFHLSAYCWSDGVGDDTSILKLLQKTQRQKKLTWFFYECITRFLCHKIKLVRVCDIYAFYAPHSRSFAVSSVLHAVCLTSLNDSNEYVCLRHLIKLHRVCVYGRELKEVKS